MSIEFAPAISGAPASSWKRYPAYRDSGVEWLGEVPEEWETWKVTHGFQKLGSGTTPKSDDPQYYNDIIPWVTTSELRETVITDTKSKLSEKAMKDYSSLRIYPPETLLFAMYGATIGRMGILGIPATVNQACCAFTGSKFLDSKFTFYWLWMARPILIALSVGGGQPNLSQDDLRKIRIPAPSLPEQRAIAAFLDHETGRIDTLIEKKRRQVELLQEKRAALISHAVTKGLDPDVKMKDSGVEWIEEVPEEWGVIRVKLLEGNDTSVVQTGPFGAQLHASDYLDDGVPLILIRNVRDLKIDETDIPRISKEDAERLSMYRLNIGDIVFSRVGSIGRIALCTEREKGWLISGQMLRLRIQNPILDSKFSLYAFSSKCLLTFVELQSVGSTRESINTDILRNMPIPIPPLSEQRAIAAFLDRETGRIDNLTIKIHESISKLREYRTALISAAVTGKIDVREGV
ncbi:MAG: restriction endonuclease subunit S [ANME-2 cluster archaeon]|jgi:type I restriction enzyme S subunit|nr:restriction endonuclease subunit S [ANME-2 cluster archaeon]